MLFEQATKAKLRFNHRGVICTEDLWDLSLKSLDTIYKGLRRQAKQEDEDSLLDEKTSENETLNLQIAVVKHIADVKISEKKMREAAAERKAKKEKIMTIIATKQDEALHGMNIEDLQKLLSEL
jgi:hypothetical protein